MFVNLALLYCILSCPSEDIKIRRNQFIYSSLPDQPERDCVKGVVELGGVVEVDLLLVVQHDQVLRHFRRGGEPTFSLKSF